MPVDHAHQHDHAEIGVIPAIDQQGFERGCFIARRGWKAGDNRFQYAFDIQAGFGGNQHGLRRIKTNDFLDLFLHPFRFSGG